MKKQTDPTFVRRIGILPQSNNCYGLCSDGNVWLYGVRLISNCGTLDEFMGHVKAGGMASRSQADEYRRQFPR
jgi:hypothetical protein